MGQSNSPSENYLFLNVMVSFVIVNQKLTGSALHIEKNQTILLNQAIFCLSKPNGHVIIIALSRIDGRLTVSQKLIIDVTWEHYSSVFLSMSDKIWFV